MSTKKPSIPVTSNLPRELAQLIAPIKENIEIMNGTRGGELTALASTATTSDIITAVNTIIAKLDASGY